VYDDELLQVSLLLLPAGGGQYSIPDFLEAEEDVPQRAMMCEELDLSGAVEEDVVVCGCISICSASVGVSALVRTSELLQAFCQPVKVVLQLFQRKQDSAIRAKTLLLHNLVYRDQISHVDGGLIGGAIVRGVEVDDGALALDGAHELLHAIAVRRLAGAGRADDQLRERHLCCCGR
jgi:hypothetical protein